MKPVPDYQAAFVDNYDQAHAKTTLAGSFLQRSHQLLEATLPATAVRGRVIEVGAGSGHHFTHLRAPVAHYTLTDLSPAMLDLSRVRYAREIAAGAMTVSTQDATRLDFPDASFDRLIATHVLEHIPDPVDALREWDRVVKKGGVISLVLPCDPGMLWRLGRHFGPRRNAQKNNLPYDYVMAAEHINSIYNLVVFLQYHFPNIKESWYPLKVPFADLNLFYICHIQK